MNDFDEVVRGDGSEARKGPIRHRKRARKTKGELLEEARRLLLVSESSTELAKLHIDESDAILQMLNREYKGNADPVEIQRLSCDYYYELERSAIASRQARRYLDKHKWMMWRARFTRG